MFFFPNHNYVKKLVARHLDLYTFLLVLGLYIKDLLKGE